MRPTFGDQPQDLGKQSPRHCDLSQPEGDVAAIPPKSNRRSPEKCDYRTYNDRNCVERMFKRLKQFRRITTRYDKTARSFPGFLCLVDAKLWLPSFVNRT